MISRAKPFIKRTIPFYKEKWIDELKNYLENWDFSKEQKLLELEYKISNYIGRKYGIATNSTTNSIFMCLYIWSKKYPNRNQVIMPNWGYPATFKACKILGLTPVFVDIEKKTLSMSSKKINLTSNILAVVHVENNGVVGNAKNIFEMKYVDNNILFIEDCAPSLLQSTAGNHGDVSMFSFSPTKPFCSGEGSVILTDDDELYSSLKNFRYIGEYNNLKPSLNFAMSCLLAAYLLSQFDYIDEIIDFREKVHKEYKLNLDIFEEPYISTNRHGAIMYLSKKAEYISKRLSIFGVEHRYRYYPNFVDDKIQYPISCEVRDQIIDLPMHHELSSEQIKFVCNIIKRAENGS